MTKKISPSKLCKICGIRDATVKGMCNRCYQRDYNQNKHGKPKDRVKVDPTSKFHQLPQGVFDLDGFLYFDRSFEYSYDNPRELTIQYKASGIQTSTVKMIVSAKFPDILLKTIQNWINYFQMAWTFRKCNGALLRDPWYKEQEIKQMSKTAPISDNPFNFVSDEKFVTKNQPLINQRHRRNKGLTKVEKRLVTDIKNHTDYWLQDNFFKK